MSDDLDQAFSERRRLLSLAYRMTGTLADAEDVVQETYMRWFGLTDIQRAQVKNMPGWLTRAASRIALDLLGSARRRREQYIGQWLPEPVPAGLFAGTASAIDESVTAAPLSGDPLDRIVLDDAVSTALLLVLENMTPAERVAFTLHDVFGVPFDEIATIVGRTPTAVRQLASTGRRHVREHRTSVVATSEHDSAVRAFRDANRTGDIDQLLRVLAPDVQLRADGGGFISAAPNVVTGADRVARFLLGIGAKQPTLTLTIQRIGDGLGLILRDRDRTTGVASLHVEDGLVTDVWIMLNPQKLTEWLPTPKPEEEAS